MQCFNVLLDTGVLHTTFSQGVSRAIIEHVVQYLLGGEQALPVNTAVLLPAQCHVMWFVILFFQTGFNFVSRVVECVGEGFRLPIADHHLIQLCVDLYTRWIQAPQENKPPWIRLNVEAYYVVSAALLFILCCSINGVPIVMLKTYVFVIREQNFFERRNICSRWSLYKSSSNILIGVQTKTSN